MHGYYPKLSGGDLLIIAGDLTARDEDEGWNEFEMWILNEGCKYKERIIVGGNHDNFLQTMDVNCMRKYWDKLIPTCNYLCDSATEFDGFRIWGSPWTKTFPRMNPKCKAFTVDTEEELDKKWKEIPDDIDILITHGPPFGILDSNVSGEKCGSVSLRNMVLDGTYFKKLKYHIFGHIHECGGKILDLTCCKFINASHVNERYKPVNTAIRIEL